jgi:hypothetical protein
VLLAADAKIWNGNLVTETTTSFPDPDGEHNLILNQATDLENNINAINIYPKIHFAEIIS